MSLEQQMNDLTVAVRDLVTVMRAGKTVMTETEAPAAKIGRPKLDKAPVPMMATKAVEPSVSKEVLFNKLKEHGAVHGIKATKVLMMEHGADKVNVTTASIPTASYQALYDAAVKQLPAQNEAAAPEEVFV